MLALQSRVEIIKTSTMHSSYYGYVGKKGTIIDIDSSYTHGNNILYHIKLDGYMNLITFSQKFVIYDPTIEMIIENMFINLIKLEKIYENVG